MKNSALIAGLAVVGAIACTTVTKNVEPEAVGEREPAAVAGRVSFRQEFAEARILNSVGALRSYEKRPGTKQQVLAKWAGANPREVRAELDRLQKDEGQIDIGRVDVSSKNGTAPGVLVYDYNDARAVLHSPDFGGDVPAAFENMNVGRVTTAKVSQVNVSQAKVNSLATELVNEQAYQGVNMSGQAFARLDVVQQVGRLLPHLVNKMYLDMNKADYYSSVRWARVWRDAGQFNVQGDPAALQRARALVKDPTVVAAAKAHGYQVIGFLDSISRGEVTQTAVAHVLDVLLTDKRTLQLAKIAASKADQKDLAAIIREALRIKPVKPVEIRIAKKDVRLPSGKQVNAGDALIVLTSVANRDPQQFDNPNGFNSANEGSLGHLIFEKNDQAELSLAETKAAVAALVSRPGLRRVEGHAGEIDRRSLIKGHLINEDEFRRTFPEQFAVEWDIGAPSDDLQIPHPQYAYDAYLMDFDRRGYRLCLSSQMPENFGKRDIVRAIFTGLEIKKLNQVTMDNRDLFFCRLNQKFRDCIIGDEKVKGFHHLAPSAAHKAAFQACDQKAPLTKTERAFYEAVMLGGELRTNDLETKQAKRNTGDDYKWEDHIVFYDRFRARASMMNPAGQVKLTDRDILFYVRLNIDFRTCMGMPVIKHDVAAKIGVKAGASRDDQYEVCKDGVWNQASLRKEGKLSREEKFFYETIMLGRKVSFADVK